MDLTWLGGVIRCLMPAVKEAKDKRFPLFFTSSMPKAKGSQRGWHGRRAACMSNKQEGHRCRNVHRKTGQDVMSTIHSTSQFRDVVHFRTSMIRCAVSSLGPHIRDMYTSWNIGRCLSGRVVVFGVVVCDGTCNRFLCLGIRFIMAVSVLLSTS